MKINKNLIKDCSMLMDKLGLTELEYTEGSHSIKLSKNKNKNFSKQRKDQDLIEGKTEPKKNFKEIDNSIKAPLVGTIYLKPEPTAKPFIELGQKVKVGQVLLIIEAMKTMNEIKSDKNGEVKKIYAKDASPVEFGEPLVLIE
mgnify:CR=1 FL=1|tara:strand:- start:310 stop:738 length:429 start_codon:yes stop_codon:yes gene_type:complete